MLTFQDDGSITIDFGANAVRVKAPTFGGMKRLRAERVRLARDAAESTAKWRAEHPAPEGDDDASAVEIGLYNQEVVLATEEANLVASVAWWRLVLVGDDTFKKLAEADVPADTDEWPADLLYDFRSLPRPGATLDDLLAAQSLIEQVFRWWGKGRSRSSDTPAATPTPS